MADSRIPSSSFFYPKRLRLYDEIFIGHTPTTNYDIDTPMNKCNVWNVDTGAAFSGRITVMDIDSKRYWQSDVGTGSVSGGGGKEKAVIPLSGYIFPFFGRMTADKSPKSGIVRGWGNDSFVVFPNSTPPFGEAYYAGSSPLDSPHRLLRLFPTKPTTGP